MSFQVLNVIAVIQFSHSGWDVVDPILKSSLSLKTTGRYCSIWKKDISPENNNPAGCRSSRWKTIREEFFRISRWVTYFKGLFLNTYEWFGGAACECEHWTSLKPSQILGSVTSLQPKPSFRIGSVVTGRRVGTSTRTALLGSQ